MFTKIKEKIIANKSSLLKIAVFLGIYFLFSDFAFATDKTTGKENDIVENLFAVLDWGVSIGSLILALFAYLVTLFLSPEWTTGNIFGISGKLKDIWILISNVVYLVFGFLIIAIAFLNIIGNEKYILKKSLPKLIVGILIVPFSWFVVQFLVSLSSILTMGALNLPFDIFSQYQKKIVTQEIPTNCEINIGVLTKQKGENNNETKNFFDCDKNIKKPFGELLKSPMGEENIFGMMALYVYGIVNVENLDKILKEQKSGGAQVKVIGDVIVKLLFDGLFVLVYIFLFIAIGLALMIRGVWLWIYMALSPFFGLMYFFGKGEGGSDFFKKFSFSQLVALAMVPVYTMLALSFGLFFLYTVGDGLAKIGGEDGTKNESTFKVENSKGKNNESQTLKIGNSGIELKITGTTGTFEERQMFAEGGLGIIGALILKIFGIVVLWGVLIVALNSSTITKEIITPIANFGESIGKTVSSLPQYIPILPEGQSLKSLEHGINSVISGLESEYGSKRGTQLANKFLGNDTIAISNIDDFKRVIDNSSNKNNKEAQRNALKYITDNYFELLNDDKSRNLMNEYFKNMGYKSDFKSNSQILDLKKAIEGIKDKHTSVRDVIDTGVLATLSDFNLNNLVLKTGTKPTTQSNITLNSDGKLSQEIFINLKTNTGIDIKGLALDTNNKVSEQIKNNLNGKNITEQELKTALSGKGLSDDDINKIIKELGNIVTP